MRIQSEAEYARSRAGVSPATKWRREAEVWFDGSVESVDRRLGLCQRLLTAARGRLGAGGFSNSSLDGVAELERQLTVLSGLRRDLLTAASDREESVTNFDHRDPDDRWERPDPKLHEMPNYQKDGRLAPQDRRFVDLEAAKFARAHRVPLDELQTRAANFAQEATSTLPRARSRAITAAFVRKVSTLYRPPVRTAAARPSNQDFPPELMFI